MYCICPRPHPSSSHPHGPISYGNLKNFLIDIVNHVLKLCGSVKEARPYTYCICLFPFQEPLLPIGDTPKEQAEARSSVSLPFADRMDMAYETASPPRDMETRV